jgi:hypothetical protein
MEQLPKVQRLSQREGSGFRFPLIGGGIKEVPIDQQWHQVAMPGMGLYYTTEVTETADEFILHEPILFHFESAFRNRSSIMTHTVVYVRAPKMRVMKSSTAFIIENGLWSFQEIQETQQRKVPPEVVKPDGD